MSPNNLWWFTGNHNRMPKTKLSTDLFTVIAAHKNDQFPFYFAHFGTIPIFRFSHLSANDIPNRVWIYSHCHRKKQSRACVVVRFFFILIFSLCVIDGTSFRSYVFGSNRVEMYCSNNFWYFFLFNESDFLHLHLLLWIEWFRLFRMEFVLNEISMVYNTSKLIEKFAIYKCKTGEKSHPQSVLTFNCKCFALSCQFQARKIKCQLIISMKQLQYSLTWTSTRTNVSLILVCFFFFCYVIWSFCLQTNQVV